MRTCASATGPPAAPADPCPLDHTVPEATPCLRPPAVRRNRCRAGARHGDDRADLRPGPLRLRAAAAGDAGRSRHERERCGLVSSATYLAYMVANVPSCRWSPAGGEGGRRWCGGAGHGRDGDHRRRRQRRRDRRRRAGGGIRRRTGLPAVRRHRRPAGRASRRDLVWSTISSGTGWGVAIAGPIAIVAGDQWRLAWAGFVVIAVVTGIVATRLAPARRRLVATAAAEPELVLLPAVAATADLGRAGRCGECGLVGVQRRRDAERRARHHGRPGGLCGLRRRDAPRLGQRLRVRAPGLRRGYLGTIVLLGVARPTGRRHAELAWALVAAVLFGAFYASVIAAHGMWWPRSSRATPRPASRRSAPR